MSLQSSVDPSVAYTGRLQKVARSREIQDDVAPDRVHDIALEATIAQRVAH